ncbi:MAG TPA: hypothetical protein VM802_05090 [Chitinophaga sp.]|uniref:RNA polymerase sigma factor n=1 Tax=Chitinophaga sp. TaxID=1869181 RepID=UPI002C94065B|nr:hypothetical protein [Chitinophaga sp.]HVI44217.1 hypothetical protein [Chitinophaga sp.]
MTVADGTIFRSIMNEQELLKQLALGNEEAFTVIYLQYHGGIYNYLLKFTKNPALTEDPVHDVFLKIWEVRSRPDITSGKCLHICFLNYFRQIPV